MIAQILITTFSFWELYKYTFITYEQIKYFFKIAYKIWIFSKVWEAI